MTRRLSAETLVMGEVHLMFAASSFFFQGLDDERSECADWVHVQEQEVGQM